MRPTKTHLKAKAARKSGPPDKTRRRRQCQPHHTTFMWQLNGEKGADIDNEIVPLVKFLNRLGVVTISSCQGDPGNIEEEGGSFGHVAFIDPRNPDSYEGIAKLTFGLLREMFAHLYDSVRVEISRTESLIGPPLGFPSIPAYIGWLRFRNECAHEISQRLGAYCDMAGK
jgi:hypothetical protein